MRARRLAVLAALAVLGAAIPGADGAVAKPSAKPKVDRARAAPKVQAPRPRYRFRYYRRLQPDAVRRALSGDAPKPQISPRTLMGR